MEKDHHPPEAMIIMAPKGMKVDEERKKEVTGLINNGTLVAVPRKEVPSGMRILGSKLIDEIMSAGTGIRKQSRLVAKKLPRHRFYKNSYKSFHSTKIFPKDLTSISVFV